MLKIVRNIRELTDKSFLQFCIKYIHPSCKVLEIGPGDGFFAERLIRNFPNLDYQFVDIKDNRKYQLKRKMWLVDISREPLKVTGGNIDVVIASQVIEHIRDVTGFILEIHRLLKDRGMLLLKFPNYSNLFQRIVFFKNGLPHRLQGKIKDGGHINFLPYKYIENFTQEYFYTQEVRGDFMLEPIISPKVFKLFNKNIYLVSESIRHLLFSWNVMISMIKISK